MSSWFKDIFLMTILIALLFGTFLGSRPFSVPDEGRYSEIPREMIERGDYVTPYLNGIKYFEKPPLLYWLQAGAIKVFGLSEWALRLPTAVVALLGCLITYAGARLLYNRRTGWLSGLILSSGILYFAMAHSITLDMTVSVAITAALLAFIVGVQYPPGAKRRWFLWAMYAFAGLAVLTKGLIGIVFPGAIIGIWILICRQWQLLKHVYLPSGILLFLVITVPWHWLVQSANPEFFHFYFIEQHFERYFTMSAGRYKPVWFFIPIALAGFFPWTLFLTQAIYHQVRPIQKPALFLLLWAGLIFIFFSFSKSKLIPYILPIFPPLAIITGHYLSNRMDEPNTKGIRVGFQLLPLCAIVMGLLIAYSSYIAQIPELTATTFALRTVAAALVISALLTYIAYRLYALRTVIIVLLLTNSAFLISITTLVPHLDLRSTKPLATVLKPLLKPSDEVIAYGLYYQDLPFYLRQQITVVEWVGELEFGLRHQPAAKEWIIDKDMFWNRWNSNKRVFVIVSQRRYPEISQQQPPGSRPSYVLARSWQDLLISNYP